MIKIVSCAIIFLFTIFEAFAFFPIRSDDDISRLTFETKSLVRFIKSWQEQIQMDPMKNSFLSYCQNLKSNDPEYNKKVEECTKFYSNLFSKEQINFSIFIGYRDDLPNNLVYDLVEKLALVELFTSRCSTTTQFLQSCGFSRDPDDANKLYKLIKTPQGITKKVNLTLQESSIGLDGKANKFSPEQKLKSEKVTAAFEQALINSDVIYYFGHSRKGGGPDFAPAEKTTSNNHVDYNWYGKKRPGLKKMLAALKKRNKNKELVLGMFSCSSKQNFGNDFKKSGLKNTILTTQPLTDAELIPGIVTSMSALLNFSCDKSLGLAPEYYHQNVFNK